MIWRIGVDKCELRQEEDQVDFYKILQNLTLKEDVKAYLIHNFRVANTNSQYVHVQTL